MFSIMLSLISQSLQNNKTKTQSKPINLSSFHKKIYDDALDAVGRTPMIRINKIGKQEGIACQILAKCQFMGIGGSVKVTLELFLGSYRKKHDLDCLKRGKIKTWTKGGGKYSWKYWGGVSLACSVKGYDSTIVMSSKFSAQKSLLLEALGSKVIRTPSIPGVDFEMAEKLEKQGAFYCSQFTNQANASAHYCSTAEQILYQCQDQKIDAIIIATASGGTVTGIAQRFKQRSPDTIIVAIDSQMSVLAQPQSLNKKGMTSLIEGVGFFQVPKLLNRNLINQWIKADDVETFRTARKLISKQGLLVGGSSGAAMSGAIQFIKMKGWENDPSKRVVVIFADGVRNYMTKFLSKEWCIQNKIIPYEQLKQQGNILNGKSLDQCNLEEIKAYEDLSVGEARDLFQKGTLIIPIKFGENIVSALTPNKFLQMVTLNKFSVEETALKAGSKDGYAIVPHSLDAAQLSKIVMRHSTVIVQKRSQDKCKIEKLWVATAESLFKFL